MSLINPVNSHRPLNATTSTSPQTPVKASSQVEEAQQLREIEQALRNFQSLIADAALPRLKSFLNLFAGSGVTNKGNAPFDFSQNEVLNHRILVLKSEQLQKFPVNTRLLSLSLGQSKSPVTIVKNEAGENILKINRIVDGQDNLVFGLKLSRNIQQGERLDQLVQESIAENQIAKPLAAQTSSVLGRGVLALGYVQVGSSQIQKLPIGIQLIPLTDDSAKYAVVQTELGTGQKILAVAQGSTGQELYFAVKREEAQGYL